jgi:TRAP-type uncharacterized transport system substrate-binding protein
MPGGMFHTLGDSLKKKLGTEHHPVELPDTLGTPQNIRMLEKGEVDLAIIGFDICPSENISIIAPLYYEPILILVKKDLPVDTVFDLQGRPVCVWPKDSGLAKSAEMVLNFYDQEVERLEVHCFEEYSSWDAAIVAFGLLAPSLQDMVQTGAYKIIGLPVTKALSASSAFVNEFTVPKGVFSREPHMLPAQDIQTVASTALLAVNNQEASSLLINETLDAIYASDLTIRFPMLMSQKEAKTWSKLPLHPTAREYFEPYRKIGVIANFMESLAAVKELLFAFAAVSYFLWLRIKEMREKKEKEELKRMKEELDCFLEIIMESDKKQMKSDSREELINIMQQVTDVKMTALKELTNERLRSDQMFSIFLMESHNVIAKIQAKLLMLR